jgi:hypothetical protein
MKSESQRPSPTKKFFDQYVGGMHAATARIPRIGKQYQTMHLRPPPWFIEAGLSGVNMAAAARLKCVGDGGRPRCKFEQAQGQERFSFVQRWR